MADHPGPHFLAEQPLQHVLVHRQRVLREDRIAELLELFHDLVIEPRIVVIRPAQHDDADAVLALELVHRLAGASADARVVLFERLEADLDGALVLLFRETENGVQAWNICCANSFLSRMFIIGLMYVMPCSAKTFVLFGEGGLHRLRRRRTVGQAFDAGQLDQRRAAARRTSGRR